MKALIILLTLFCGEVLAQNVNVTNVHFQQRSDGTFYVDIYYDLALTNASAATVTMQASSDSGSTWALSCNSISGAVGSNVTLGANKHIVWNFAAEHPRFFNEKVRIKITADDGYGFVCGTSTVTYSGKTYNTVQVGSQCWIKENLNVGTRVNGIANQDATNGTIEKYCFNDDEANCTTYGGLYQWSEAMKNSTTAGTQGICPSGWHIPSQAEFNTLATSVGGNSNALKAIGQGSGGGAGTNMSGFSALLAGSRYTNGTFNNLGYLAYFWSSTETDATSASTLPLYGDDSTINLYFYNSYKEDGLSVRCVQD